MKTIYELQLTVSKIDKNKDKDKEDSDKENEDVYHLRNNSKQGRMSKQRKRLRYFTSISRSKKILNDIHRN